MSSSDPAGARRRFLSRGGAGLAAFALAGCNLRPMYAPGGEGAFSGTLPTIDVKIEQTRMGQALRNQLLTMLNPDGQAQGAPEYALYFETQRYENPLAIQLNATITRYDLILLASFQLRRVSDQAIVYQSAVREVASYNVVRAPYATAVAAEDAERRAIKEIALDIRNRLALYFSGLRS